MTKAIPGGMLLKKWAYLIISLSLSVLACQTTGTQKSNENDKEEKVLTTQKEMIRNHLNAGEPDAALRIVRDMVRLYPEDPSLLTLMGLTQLALRNPGKATQYFRQAYKLDKQPASALNLSSAYIEMGSPEKAQALLAALLKDKKATKDYPYKERIYHNIAYAYVKLGKSKLSEQWFHEALEENPTFFPAHLELARLYEKTKRPGLAQKSYRRAIDYCQVCFEPVQGLANIQLQTGNLPDAHNTLLRFTKTEGVAPSDRAKAVQMMKSAVALSNGKRRAG